MWCIGTLTGEYLANREDVLDVYAQPAEAGVVRLCFDERPCQLLDHVLTPIPPKPGATQKEHQEYVRKGVCNVLLAYDIDTGQRHLRVTTTKNKGDYAHFMDWLVQSHYPDAQKIKLVQDNYSTHTYGAFYEHLPVETARNLRHTLEFHYTPSTAPGSTWPKLNSPPFPASAWTSASARRNDSKRRPGRGKPNETRRPSRSTGPSRPKRPVIN
ncbi:transposase [Hymenobacter siberiensis]|uniref:transposase n=1 Tax=Hymenobacter siberiensis TaxID=2848396 RepID=UPI001C1E3186|nr:transposase [Hymenobacter siberiensis]MBU6123085.1 transposase [Hymenobacter siberiensis]